MASQNLNLTFNGQKQKDTPNSENFASFKLRYFPWSNTAGNASWSYLGGIIAGVPTPTLDDGFLTSAFFSSYVVDGITYTWDQANNW